MRNAHSPVTVALAWRCRPGDRRRRLPDPRRAPTAAAGTTVKIMVGGIDKVIYLPAKLTEQLGYFKDEGLDVKLLTEPAGAPGRERPGRRRRAGRGRLLRPHHRPADQGQVHRERGPARRRARRGGDRRGRQGRPDHLARPTSRARSSASPAPARPPTSSPSTWPPRTACRPARLHHGQGRRRADVHRRARATAASTPA